MNLEQLIRPNILTLEPYRCAREKVLEGVLLDANENPFAHDWQGVRLNRYPDPYQRRLRDLLASYVGVSPENIAAGVGSDEVLEWIFKVFCQPGQDEVVIAEPTYGMYRVAAQIFGVTIKECRLDGNFQFSADKFLAEVGPAAKVLFVCSPNNPTGNLLDTREILKVCKAWGKVVVVDEAYLEFSGAPSAASYLNEHENLIVLRTLSKAFGRAGLRVGYAVTSPAIVSYFLKVKTPYNLSALTMDYACRTLADWGQSLGQVEEIRCQREKVASRLRQIPGVETVYPSDANFLLFRCREARAVVDALFEQGIVVRDRSTVAGLQECIRVSIGTVEENELFLGELTRINADK
jgi:histidinol-phosphate aminotransferase